MAELLIEKGADINVYDVETGDTPLLKAIARGIFFLITPR